MVNKVILIGNLGNDPDTRYTKNGSAVVNFNLATTEKWKGQDGEWKESTEWHKITVFGKLAEICGQYLSKGSKAYVDGKIKTEQWNDKDGNKRYTTGIVAREVKFLSPRQDNQLHGAENNVPEMSTGEDVPF